jgi:hypothetical protein
MSIVGILSFVGGIFLSGVLLAQRIFFGTRAPGWTSILITVLVLQGVQMLMAGVLGEYVWRTLDQARSRLPYIVDYEAPPDRTRAGGSARDDARTGNKPNALPVNGRASRASGQIRDAVN